MLPKINPLKTKSYPKLKAHAKEMKKIHLRDLFEKSDRFGKFSLAWNDFLFDYSKNIIDQKALSLLLDFAKEMKLGKAIESMFSGELINETEKRAVLHTALRKLSPESEQDRDFYIGEQNVSHQVREVQEKIKSFCGRFHSGAMTGYTGKKFTDIVNIGIGGSDLGPVMVTEALRPDWKEGIHVHFVSNIDPSHIHTVLKEINFETTLFLIASKTFTTQETMANANTAKKAFLDSGAQEKDTALHFAALSTNIPKVTEFGITPENTFAFWDWVGGRFSLWSAIGLSIALTIGYDKFLELLRGAREADLHFRHTVPERNIPILMAVIGFWYTAFWGSQTEAILPYDQYLHRFPAYLQQGIMESNGKSVDRMGKKVQYPTSPVIWGEPGTNGQHAFYQAIHQGTHFIPSDFIAAVHSRNNKHNQHQILLSNCFAQTEALMKGKTKKEVMEELSSKGMSKKEMEDLAPYKVFPGNRPSNTFLIKEINPRNLGSLIAFYEHKIFTQGVLWNIFSFDQFGVELGKVLANVILPEIEDKNTKGKHDSSTTGLIRQYHEWKG